MSAFDPLQTFNAGPAMMLANSELLRHHLANERLPKVAGPPACPAVARVPTGLQRELRQRNRQRSGRAASGGLLAGAKRVSPTGADGASKPRSAMFILSQGRPVP